MTWYLFLGAFLVCLIALLALRVPVAFAMLGVGIAGALFSYNTFNAGIRQVGLSVISSVDSFVFTAIPLFILMGELLFQSGVAQRALDEISKVLRHLPGRLAMVAVGGGALFGLLSGSSLANTALFGRTLLPEMTARNYDEKLGIGSILASGGLAMVLPPSAFAILWGGIAGVPIGPLLIAGIIPGLLMTLGYTIIVVVWAKRSGLREPATPRRSVTQWLKEGTRDALPPGLLIAAVLGMIFFGIATPTESAAIGALLALILGLVTGKLGFKKIIDAAKATVQTTAMIFLIVLGSNLYGQLMSFNGATAGLVKFVTGTVDNGALVLLLVMITVLILGAFIDQVSIMMVTAPLFMPLVESFGWDPIWFSLLLMINLQIANTTPPFGMGLFVMKGVAPHASLPTLYRAALPWIGSDVVVMGLVAAIPSLALFLPQIMG